MDRLKEYKVAFRGLKEGEHLFCYTLDDAFFDCFEATKGIKAKIDAEVLLIKSSLLMQIKIKEKGSVRTICDRCLGECDIDFEGEIELFVKIAERDSGNDDDYIVLSPDEDYLDFGTYLYETYMLNYPMRVLHQDGECDQDMQGFLEQYVHEETDKPTDPRWDELKKLINN